MAMGDDPDDPANNNRSAWERVFGSFAPAARRRRLWLALMVIALIGLIGLAFVFMQ